MDIEKFLTENKDLIFNTGQIGGEILITFKYSLLTNFLENFKSEICREQRIKCVTAYTDADWGSEKHAILAAPEPELMKEDQ